MQQPADELREAELDRVDRLQLALWPKAMKGDNASINTIIRLMERRARLLGLDTPIKIQQDITTWTGDDSIDRAVRDLAALLTANDENSSGASDVGEHQGEIEPITAGDELEELVDPIGSGLGQDSDRLGVDSMESPTTAQD